MTIFTRLSSLERSSTIALVTLLGACGEFPGSGPAGESDGRSQSLLSHALAANASAATERAAPDKVALAAEAIPVGWVRMPGAIVRRECVHEVPKGATVDENGNVRVGVSLVAHYNRCTEPVRLTQRNQLAPSAVTVSKFHPHHNTSPSQIGAGPINDGAWVETNEVDAYGYDDANGVTTLTTHWFVPEAPQNTGATFFLFAGVGTRDGNSVMQSVLQWGSAWDGGGNGWFIVSVGVNQGGYYHSPLEGPISDFDSVSSSISVQSQDPLCTNPTEMPCNSTWQIFTQTAAGWWTEFDFGFTVQPDQAPAGVFHMVYLGALEAYNVGDCSQIYNDIDQFRLDSLAYGFPNRTNFTPPFGAWYSPVFTGNPPGCSLFAGMENDIPSDFGPNPVGDISTEGCGNQTYCE
jgi:hypothetical protein